MSSPAQPPLQLDYIGTPNANEKILKVKGPLVISNFFDFQSAARENKAPLADYRSGGSAVHGFGGAWRDSRVFMFRPGIKARNMR